MFTVEEQTFIKKLKEQGKVYHPSIGEVSRRDKEALPYYFDPGYGDWIAPTEPGHDAVAGIKSWRRKNPLVPGNSENKDRSERRSGDRGYVPPKNPINWKEKNPLIPCD